LSLKLACNATWSGLSWAWVEISNRESEDAVSCIRLLARILNLKLACKTSWTGLSSRVVTRTITDGRTMAVGSSVNWTHCSICYEVT
jgi:hypothetical protein